MATPTPQQEHLLSHTKPRIVIIGAGIAGLSAAYRLVSSGSPNVELSIVEASSRIGGRIHTSSLAGSRVELGATWIHGIQGSPVYEIADRIGSLEASSPSSSYERQDGFPIFSSTVAEGGLVVEEAWMEPAVRAFNSAIDEVKGKEVEIIGTNASLGPIETKTRKRDCSSSSSSSSSGEEEGLVPASVGSFVRKLGLHALAEYESGHGDDDGGGQELGFGWDLRSLRAAVFHMQEDMERLGTASNSLFDVDLASEREYEEFPGKHMTIGGGYVSVLEEMAGALPRGTVRFGKKVAKVVWNRTNNAHHPHCGRPVLVMCADGSAIEADHVIVTVSLGVLKASTSAPGFLSSGPVSHPDTTTTTNGRSVDELRGLSPSPEPSSPRQLFQPPLPTWKLAAISRLGFGVVNKLFLEVDPAAPAVFERIFGSFVELIPRRHGDPRGSTIPPWMRKTFSICPIFKGSNVLLCWFAGAEALDMEELSDEEIVDGVVATLMSFGLHRGCNEIAREEEEEEEEEESTRQRLKRSFVRVLRSKWGTNPLCKGSYTFVAAGASGMDIEALAEPIPNVKPPISSFFSAPVPPMSSDDGKVLSGNFPPNMSHTSLASTISSLSVASSSTQSSSESMSSSDHEEESEDEDIVHASTTTARGEKPLQLLFAGEATHRHYYSTTHGAFLSGVREAERILEFYHFRK